MSYYRSESEDQFPRISVGPEGFEKLSQDIDMCIQIIDETRTVRVQQAKEYYTVGVLNGSLPKLDIDFDKLLSNDYAHSIRGATRKTHEFIQHAAMHGKNAFSAKRKILQSLKAQLFTAKRYKANLLITESERRSIGLFTYKDAFENIQAKYERELQDMISIDN